MTTERIDPLAVIRKHAAAHVALATSDAYSAQEAPRLLAAATAVAELVEADREYDAARDDVRHAMGRGRSHLLPRARERHESAKARRAAALAAFGRQG